MMIVHRLARACPASHQARASLLIAYVELLRIFAVIVAAVTGSLCLATMASGAPSARDFVYPTKSVRVLVGFAPGGGSDTLGRIVGQRLSERLSQPVVIDNRPGANGVIAMELTAKAPADGYTLMLISGSSVVSATLVTKVTYDLNKAFAPVSLLAMQPYILLVPRPLPVNTVKELVQYAKSKPGALNYGSSGHGSSAHLGMELLKQMAGLDMVHVAYKGIGPAIVDLVGGQVQLLFASAVSAAPALQTGKVKALAVTSLQRAKALPELPTVAESGVPGFDLTGWYGVVGPAGTPQYAVAKLNQDLRHVLNLPDVQSRLSDDGSEAAPGTPAQFRETISQEIQKWRKLMERSNFVL
jgi:tripartite-type tricarboxylate transporter receptor subunit TctC